MSLPFDPFVRYNNVLVNVNHIVTIQVSRVEIHWAVTMSLNVDPKVLQWTVSNDDLTDDKQKQVAETMFDELTRLIGNRYKM